MRRVLWLAVAAALALPSAEVAQKPAATGPVVVFETVKGTFEIELYPNEAP